jgi:hypothetical protein
MHHPVYFFFSFLLSFNYARPALSRAPRKRQTVMTVIARHRRAVAIITKRITRVNSQFRCARATPRGWYVCACVYARGERRAVQAEWL